MMDEKWAAEWEQRQNDLALRVIFSGLFLMICFALFQMTV